MSKVKEKDTVKVHYTGKLANGEVFDSSADREPIEFTLGEGQIIPGFEKGIIDMAVEDKKTISVPVKEAYGERREELIQEVPKEQLPPEIKPEVGMALMSRTPEGQEMRVTVAEVKDDSIMIDANHPLAGEELTFEVQLVEIK